MGRETSSSKGGLFRCAPAGHEAAPRQLAARFHLDPLHMVRRWTQVESPAAGTRRRPGGRSRFAAGLLPHAAVHSGTVGILMWAGMLVPMPFR